MIAGVPGAGISAFFYLLCVLAMPFVALVRAVRARSLSAGRWRLVGRQLTIALGIAGGLLAGGALMTMLATSAAPQVTADQTAQLAWQVGSTFGRIGIGFGIATLIVVLGTVQLWAVIDAIRSRRGGPHRPENTRRPGPTRQLAPVWSTTDTPQPRRGTSSQHSANAPRD